MHFGSDNQAGASQQIFDYLHAANEGMQAAYGDDEWTAKASKAIQKMFGCDAEVFLVSTGTAANSLALSCMAKPWDIILSHGQAHIINDELTAPEFFTQGARLVGIESNAAKLSLQAVDDYLSHDSAHPPHNAVPTVLSLTQVTESGQVYTAEQVTEFCTLAHKKGLTVHMDGARFANAVASLDCHPADITWKAGVDVLCLGATKNGALSAEAVVFFNKDLAKNFIQQRKRSGHLISKSRWLGAQFVGWLEDNHWLELATHANKMATALSTQIEAHPDTSLVWPTKANEIFALLPKTLIAHLRKQGAVFHEWPSKFMPASIEVQDHQDPVRLVTSFRTTLAEVEMFAKCMNK